ncbi:MAG: hypothetical protein Q9224_003942, partial [Gallowayella concinna]
MPFQLAKLLVVRGAWFARILGFIYFLSWLVIEILSIVYAQHTFTPLEREAAFELAEVLNAPNWKHEDEREYPLSRNPATAIGNALLVVHGFFNWISLGRILGFRTFYGLFFSFIVFTPFITPLPLMLIADVVARIWHRFGFERSFGRLWYHNIIPSVGEADYYAAYPAYVALCSIVLEAFLFARVGGAKGSFPCGQTWKPS